MSTTFIQRLFAGAPSRGLPQGRYTVRFDPPGIPWLPGGKWAWEPAEPSGEAVELSGAEEAVLDCVGTVCAAHLLLGGNWVMVTASRPSDPDAEWARQTALDFAGAVAANVGN
jgi:hypothetical protein